MSVTKYNSYFDFCVSFYNESTSNNKTKDFIDSRLDYDFDFNLNNQISNNATNIKWLVYTIHLLNRIQGLNMTVENKIRHYSNLVSTCFADKKTSVNGEALFNIINSCCKRAFTLTNEECGNYDHLN